MQLRDAYPVDTVGGSCFLTGAYEVSEGERVVDLDLDLETKPAWGRVCLSEGAVRQMAVLLGWEISPRKAEAISRLRAENGVLRAELAEMRKAVRSVVDGAALAGAMFLLGEPEPEPDDEVVEGFEPAEGLE